MKQFISEAPKDSEEFTKYAQAVLDFIEGGYKKENPDAVFCDEKVLAAGGASGANEDNDEDNDQDSEENEENDGSESSDAEMNGDLELNVKKDVKTKHIIPKDSIELLHEAQAKQKEEEEASHKEEENSEKEDGSSKKPQQPHFNDEYLSSMDWTKVGKLPLSSYDPIKREPRFVNSEASCFYELVSNINLSYFK